MESLAQTFGGNLIQTITTVLEVIAAIGVVLLLSALLAFYFLRDGSRGWARVIQGATDWRRDALDRAGRDAVDILGGYMFGTAIISAVGAISQLAIMLILGLPFAIPVAILSFIACFIPYYGGFITTGLAFLIAVAYGSPTQIVIMFIYTIVFNLIQGNVVTPLVYNRAVNLHPAIVLLAIPAGGAIAGIAGMFLAVPILAVIATTWRTVLYVLDDQPTTSRFVPPPPDAAATLRADDRGGHPRLGRVERDHDRDERGTSHHPADAARGGLRVAGQLRPGARAHRHDVCVDGLAGLVAAARAPWSCSSRSRPCGSCCAQLEPDAPHEPPRS